MANLVTNPNFETNTTGWNLDSDFSRSNSDSYIGSWSVKHDSVSAYENFIQTSAMTVTANEHYLLRFWYKVTVNSGNAPKVQVNTTGSGFGTPVVEEDLPDSSSSWVQFAIAFTMNSETTAWIRIFNNGGDVDAFYDYFEFHKLSIEKRYIDAGWTI